MSSKFEDRINLLLAGSPLHPFDFLNNKVYYDPKPIAGSLSERQLLDQTKFAYVAAREWSEHLPLLFVIQSMTGGYRSYDVAQDHAAEIRRKVKARYGEDFLTTQNLSQYIASPIMRQRVIDPNLIAARSTGGAVRAAYPDFATFIPGDFEGFLRNKSAHPVMESGPDMQSWAFESWWVPLVYDSRQIALVGDHMWSRYGNVEHMTGDLIQFGLAHEVRDGLPPIDITDLRGRAVPFEDRAWERAKHIVDIVQRGFRNDLAVACLTAQFALDQWQRDGHPILTPKYMHDSVRYRSPESFARMGQLKSVMLPYIAQHCAPWMDFTTDQHLDMFAQEHVLTQDRAITHEAAWEALAAHQPLAGSPHFALKHKASAAPSSRVISLPTLATQFAPQVPRHTDGHYFKTHSDLFDPEHYAQLSPQEQALADLAMGAMGVFSPAPAKPGVAFFAADPKAGARARAFGAKHGLHWIKDMQSEDGGFDSPETPFSREVIAPNVAEANRITGHILPSLAKKGGPLESYGQFISTNHLLRITSAAANNPYVIPRGLDAAPSSRMRLALATDMLDTHATALILREGWETSGDDPQMALRAVQHIIGDIARPIGHGQQNIEVLTLQAQNNGTYELVRENMASLIRTIGTYCEECLSQDAPPPAKDIYLVCAQMLRISDLYTDSWVNTTTVKNAVTGHIAKDEHIDWEKVDAYRPDFFWDYSNEPAAVADLRPASQFGGDNPTFYDRLRTLLVTKAVRFFDEDDLKNLGQDYVASWRGLEAETNYAGRIVGEGTTHHIIDRSLSR
ncbi:MAG: hypothetical protein WC043_08105 [Pseudobdellovibrionaceae bacterium]